MNRNTSIFISIGVSAVLIAAALWLLYDHGTGMWPNGGRWGMGYHHMMGGGMGIVTSVFGIVLVGALALLVYGILNGIRNPQGNGKQIQTPLEILNQRYARGEIDSDEYEEKRRRLSH